MLTFKQFIAEQTLINEVFDKPVNVERDHELEPMFSAFLPRGTSNAKVHKVEGMSDMHRMFSFDNHQGQEEHHIVHLLGAHGKLGTDDIDPKNAASAYSFIIDRTKKAIHSGKSVRLQTPDDRQYGMYQKTVSRLLAKNPGKAEMHELGVQPTVQGFKAKTIVIEPSEQTIRESFERKTQPRFRMKTGDTVIQL